MRTHTTNQSQKTISFEVINPTYIDGDVGGVTLLPGIYQASDSIFIQDGDLTLDAKGNELAVWIFEIANNLTTVSGVGGNVILKGGAQANNVFWKVNHRFDLGECTFFKGNVISKMKQYETAAETHVAESVSIK